MFSNNPVIELFPVLKEATLLKAKLRKRNSVLSLSDFGKIPFI